MSSGNGDEEQFRVGVILWSECPHFDSFIAYVHAELHAHALFFSLYAPYTIEQRSYMSILRLHVVITVLLLDLLFPCAACNVPCK